MGFAFLFFTAASLPEWPGERKEMREEQADPSYRASLMIDQAVKNRKGEELGELDNLVIRRNGKVKKVILQVDGFLGIGDRLVAVPLKASKIGKEEVVCSITKTQKGGDFEIEH